MTRGPRAEASRTAARRSVCALARMVDDVLTATAQHTDATRAWLASWSTGRVCATPEHADERVRAMLDTLRDARIDVWRHVTHEPWQCGAVLRRATEVLCRHRRDEALPYVWCEANYQRHLATMQLTEIAARGGVL